MNIGIHNLHLRLGDRPVLSDIDLQLDAGEFVGLLGPNGAGKSSLLRCMAGLLPPDNGHIHLDDRPLNALPRMQRARQIAYLEQDADCHWPMMVEDVVALGRLPYRLATRRNWTELDPVCRQHIDTALEESDLVALRRRRVDGLSGGERRRVMLARTLATGSRLLLADEPAAGLDPAHQLQLMQLLAAKADEGMTVVVVLHDLALAARYCRRIVLLAGGRKVADGSPGEVLNPEQLSRTYGIRAYVGETEGLPVILPLDRI